MMNTTVAIETMDSKTINRLLDDLESGAHPITPQILDAVRNRLFAIRAELIAQLPDELKPKVH